MTARFSPRDFLLIRIPQNLFSLEKALRSTHDSFQSVPFTFSRGGGVGPRIGSTSTDDYKCPITTTCARGSAVFNFKVAADEGLLEGVSIAVKAIRAAQSAIANVCQQVAG
ncbi:hypothetical protein IF2G_05551 [Cordyceps javanica]|nr:hypothetical protein IF2G_05551 [Cordyceps javanica]